MNKSILSFLIVCVFTGSAVAQGTVKRPFVPFADWKKIPVDVIAQIDTACSTTECLLNKRNQRVATTGAGRCLGGVKRLLSNSLGGKWFTNTVPAADYLNVMRRGKEFKEVQCDKRRVSEYPNGTIFIFDRYHQNCNTDRNPGNDCCILRSDGKGNRVGKTKATNKNCSYYGHIFVKTSNSREFSGRDKSLSKWSPYFGYNCWAFLASESKLPATADLEYEYDESDVCWIDDVSGFSGFQPAADSTTDIVADTIVQMQAVDADLKQQLAASGATRQPTATAPTGNSGVQFGAFSTPAAAAEQAGAIKSKMGLTASIEPTSIGIYRVRVNNLTEPDAQKIKGECAKHKLDCYVF